MEIILSPILALRFLLLPRTSLRLSIHFFHPLICMSPLLLEIWYGQLRFVWWPGCMFKTSRLPFWYIKWGTQASGFSVEKHSNNFIVSNDVLVLEVCKRCTDVVIVKILPGYLHGSYRSWTHALVARIDHNVEEFDSRYCNSQDHYKMHGFFSLEVNSEPSV